MEEQSLVINKSLDLQYKNKEEFIGAKPNAIFSCLCPPCAIVTSADASGNDKIISVLLCLFCWPGACCHGLWWSGQPVAEAGAMHKMPVAVKMER